MSADDTLKNAAVSGLSWAAIGHVASVLLNVGFTVALLRLLMPEHFGLIAIVAVGTNGVRMVADLGLAAAVVHRQDLEDHHYDSVFWSHVVFGLVMTVVFAIAGWIASRFYASPDLIIVVGAMGAQFVVRAPSMVPMALLRKHMRFRSLAIIEVSSLLFGGVIAITLALSGVGVISLAVQPAAAALLMTAAAWPLSSWRPTVRFRKASLETLSSYGANVVAFTLINFALRHMDRFLIGKMLGTRPLGAYAKAYDLVVLPIQAIQRPVNNVLFPLLSKLQNDREASAALVLRTARAISLLTFPMMVGLFVIANRFVMVVFGARWQEMAPLLQIMSVVGALESLCMLNGSIYLSQGKTKLQLRVGAVFGVMGLSAIAIGVRWGSVGVATAYLVYTVLATYPSVRIANGLLDLPFGSIARAVAPQLLAACAMGALVWAVPMPLAGKLGEPLILVLQLVVGIVVFGGVVIGARLQGARDVLGLVRQMRRRAE